MLATGMCFITLYLSFEACKIPFSFATVNAVLRGKFSFLQNFLNSFVKNSIERELISSFFYKNVKDFQNGINIRDFLENIYLKIRDKRAGVNLKETTPQYIKKQQDRIKFLESILKEIIKGFKFIKTEKDRETGQEYIKFDL